MAKRDIIVIGASAGGVEPLKKLVGGLPADFAGSVFVVWHTAPHVSGFLADVLDRHSALPCAIANDGEPVMPGRVYVARPDYHLLLERGVVRVTRGPKENRFRPAVDPLFRSAAYAYNARVVGIVLSGALDDGTAGLWTIKYRGGTAVVQDPAEAEFASMPETARSEVAVDYCLPVAEIPDLLLRLTAESAAEADAPTVMQNEDEKTRIEVGIAAEDGGLENGIMNYGELSPFTCPDCHGVLSKIRDGKIVRYRCHTGHAYSADSLLATVSENIENSMWSAIRAVEESMMLLKQTGKHLDEADQPRLADLYRQKAAEAERQVEQMRRVVMRREQLDAESLRRQVSF